MKSERLWFLLAAGLYIYSLVSVAREFGFDAIRWARYPVFVPTGLLALCTVNHWLRSRVLGWSVFTASFVCLIAVLGALVVQVRVTPETPWMTFTRTLVMYLAVSMTGLYQLRSRAREIRPNKGAKEK